MLPMLSQFLHISDSVLTLENWNLFCPKRCSKDSKGMILLGWCTSKFHPHYLGVLVLLLKSCLKMKGLALIGGTSNSVGGKYHFLGPTAPRFNYTVDTLALWICIFRIWLWCNSFLGISVVMVFLGSSQERRRNNFLVNSGKVPGVILRCRLFVTFGIHQPRKTMSHVSHAPYNIAGDQKSKVIRGKICIGTSS